MSSNIIIYLRGVFYLFLAGIIGGAIAFVGNQLGRFIGRRKMTLFKLRPRYTSMLITVLSGMAVASITLGITWIISEPIRIAFIDREAYQNKIKELEQRIELANEARQKNIVYLKQDLIASASMPKVKSANEGKEVLQVLMAKTNEAAIKKSEAVAKSTGETFNKPRGGRLVGYIPENFNKVARELSRSTGEMLIFVRAAQNAVLGQPFYVELGTPIPNKVIFTKGEIIYRTTVNGKLDYPTIYDKLLNTIRDDISLIAIKEGLFPNPEDKSIGEFDLESLKQLARDIRKTDGPVIVEFYSAEDTKIQGPLRLKFWRKDSKDFIN